MTNALNMLKHKLPGGGQSGKVAILSHVIFYGVMVQHQSVALIESILNWGTCLR